MSDLYIDLSGDLVVTGYGDLALATDSTTRDIQQIYIRLMTEPGDFFIYPGLGTDLGVLYGMPQSPETGDMGKRLIRAAIDNGEVVGCAALHVLWEDLAEVRTVAVIERLRGTGVGHQLMQAIEERAREIGVKRIFCLTFETTFFGRHGFEEIQGTPVDADVYAEMLRSYDAGIAEFLDLESVKPNTLGNTRMLKKL